MRAALLACGLGAILCAVAALLSPQGLLAGWRAAFVPAAGVPMGAVALLLIGVLTGADWRPSLLPLAGLTPWLAIAVLPLVAQQALFVPPDPHLRLWLAWPFFAFRSLLAVLLCWAAAWALGRGRLTVTAAGLALLGYGVAVSLLATDWLLGIAPGQPNSAAGMALAALQILAAGGAACVLRLGPEPVRRDLSFLMIAACLGVPYLFFMDFLIVWYGDLPARVGWYLARSAAPWGWLAPAAVLLVLAGPIAALVVGRRALAGGTALLGLLLGMTWDLGAGGGAWALLGAAAGALLLFGAGALLLPRRGAA